MEIESYKRKDDREVTLSHLDGRWFVDMWKPDGSNLWNRAFANEDNARKEFNHWRDEVSRLEWSGSPDPKDPDNFWIDDITGERKKAD
jgi:hypothetical protein